MAAEGAASRAGGRVPFLLEAKPLEAGDHITFETRAWGLDILGFPSGSGRFDSLERTAEEMEVAKGRRLAVGALEDLPEDLHRVVERLRRACKQSRRQFYRNAVLAVLREEAERETADRYIEAYRKQPEEQTEVSAIDRLGRDALTSEPW